MWSTPSDDAVARVRSVMAIVRFSRSAVRSSKADRLISAVIFKPSNCRSCRLAWRTESAFFTSSASSAAFCMNSSLSAAPESGYSATKHSCR